MNAKRLMGQRLPTLLATSILGTGLLIGCSDKASTEAAASEPAAEVQTDTAAVATPTDAAPESTETNDTAMNDSMDMDSPTDEAAFASAMATDTATAAPIGTAPTNSTQDQQSLLTNPSTTAGTPEDTVKKALDSLYYGDAKDAADYYQVDMANFAEELANTQDAFQQTVESVTLTDTTYNDDKTRATIDGEIKLKGQKAREPLTYQLQKIDGHWKILG